MKETQVAASRLYSRTAQTAVLGGSGVESYLRERQISFDKFINCRLQYDTVSRLALSNKLQGGQKNFTQKPIGKYLERFPPGCILSRSRYFGTGEKGNFRNLTW